MKVYVPPGPHIEGKTSDQQAGARRGKGREEGTCYSVQRYII